MNTNESLIIVSMLFVVVGFLVFWAIRVRKLSVWLAALIMVLFSFIAAAILNWGDNLGVVCIGTLLAVSFGLPTLVIGYAYEKWLAKKDETDKD